MAAHSKIKYMLGLSGVASASSGTSPHIFVGDCRLLTISIVTSTISASKVTISATNDQLFSQVTATWSTLTVLPNAGVFTIDPGARFLRAERADIAINATGSVASNATVILNRYYE